jgi:hypothetical protein
MPVTFLLVRTAPVALLAAGLFSYTSRLPAAPDPAPTEPARVVTGVDVEVKCVDESTLKIKLLDDKLEVVTKYGFLQVPTSDIRRIEFGYRCPPEVAEKIAQAISRLGHPDFTTRERASADLKAYRERAYPSLLKALKNDDPEVSRRADEAIKAIQGRVPAAQLDMKEGDVVYTEDSKFTGKITAQSLRVSTLPFGEQHLKLADVRSLRSTSGFTSDEVALNGTAPVNLMTYQQQFGKELAFTLTGFSGGNGQQASLWGTDVYSLDSNLSAAAVHAGVAKAGETTVVRVRIVQSPQQFAASFRNGLTSTTYQSYPAGAFEFIRR